MYTFGCLLLKDFSYKLLFTDRVSLYMVAVGDNICPCVPLSISNWPGNTHTKEGAWEDSTSCGTGLRSLVIFHC